MGVPIEYNITISYVRRLLGLSLRNKRYIDFASLRSPIVLAWPTIWIWINNLVFDTSNHYDFILLIKTLWIFLRNNLNINILLVLWKTTCQSELNTGKIQHKSDMKKTKLWHTVLGQSCSQIGWLMLGMIWTRISSMPKK